MGHGGASRKSPNDVSKEICHQKLRRPISAYPEHWSGYEKKKIIPIDV